MSEHNEPVVSAALMRARETANKTDLTVHVTLEDTLVHTDVPTEEVPVAKPKRTRKKTVD